MLRENVFSAFKYASVREPKQTLSSENTINAGIRKTFTGKRDSYDWLRVTVEFSIFHLKGPQFHAVSFLRIKLLSKKISSLLVTLLMPA